ncbi:carboxypeptidase Q-like isoform X3 [Anthonomus grandis grandis]|uniref:carboxypeptidase Q-like isoform X3 n=1 Tax=Anthonomus grandis grandis TaxID=2921223 RepID=UPI002165128A|nr:carboxypeptidase Q-like isoform X3 [Anthonomus grandis grandis]
MQSVYCYFILALVLGFFNTATTAPNRETIQECNLNQEIIRDIQSYQNVVNSIIDFITKGEFKGKVFQDLALFTDTFGSRLTGTENLEHSIDYLLNLMNQYEMHNVHAENVTVPRWRRLKEYGELLSPRNAELPVVALGSSVGTGKNGITAEVMVVKSFDELNNKSRGEVEGKIIVYNQDWVNYDHDYDYRSKGATEASKKGAVASLVRSLTPFSMRTLYTGQQTYRNNVTKIPALCISVEDAHMLQRMQDRGNKIIIHLNVSTETLSNSTSRNVIADLTGAEYPDKIVAVTAHSDSWDAGTGSMDDGGGIFMSLYALKVLKELGLKPRRTVRSLIFTGEEQCYCGVNEYNDKHASDLENFIFVMENDEGVWNPLGLNYTAGPMGGCVLKEILKLLLPLNATRADYVENVGSDISLWTKSLIPGTSLLNENGKWFWFQHTQADTLDVIDSDQMDKALAVWASVAYVIADMKIQFPSRFE